jgi:glucose-6-phosphate 1-dehydrogenase
MPRPGWRRESSPNDCVLTIFGASGDLTKRKLIPAYETLLENFIEGDSTLFTRQDWVELAWSLMDPIIQTWQISKPRDFPNYEVGSWGPKTADDFLQRDGRHWRQP